MKQVSIMKHVIVPSAIMIFAVLSCQKQSVNTQLALVNSAQDYLSSNMSSGDFRELDFHTAIISRIDLTGEMTLKIPFLNRPVKNDFVLLITTGNKSAFLPGRIVSFNELRHENRTADSGQYLYTGLI